MTPIPDPLPCTDEDDACYFMDNPTSCAFMTEGISIYVLCDLEHFQHLKRKMTETYDVSAIDHYGDRFRIVMTSIGGRKISFCMTADGISRAIRFAEASLELQHFYTVQC